MTHVFEKIRAVEFDQLPIPVQMAHLTSPVLSVTVEPDSTAFHLVSPISLERPAPEALVPKLGIKSWRDSGTLGVIYEGMNIRQVIDRLLLQPTMSQRLVSCAWTQASLPLRLHLLRYVDFSEISEVRFLINPRECRRISTCLRGQSAQGFAAALPKVTAFAKEIAGHLPQRSHILDIGYLGTGGIWLIDVNPGLTPGDITVLKSHVTA